MNPTDSTGCACVFACEVACDQTHLQLVYTRLAFDASFATTLAKTLLAVPIINMPLPLVAQNGIRLQTRGSDHTHRLAAQRNTQSAADPRGLPAPVGYS